MLVTLLTRNRRVVIFSPHPVNQFGAAGIFVTAMICRGVVVRLSVTILWS